MYKKQTTEIIKKLINYLNNKEETIAEIAKNTKINYHTTKKYIQMLLDANILNYKLEKNKVKYYIINKDKQDLNSYFAIPFNNEIKEKVFAYYNYITKKWQEYTSKKISKLQVYKILYSINKKYNLGLPFGWYKYGAICAIAYDGDYSQFNSILNLNVQTALDKKIKQIIKETPKITKTKHYLEENQKTHLLKEEIITELNKPTINLNKIIIKYNKLLDLTNILIDKKNFKVLEDYKYLLEDILETKKIKIPLDLLRDSFNQIWGYIALFIYKNNLEQYKNKKLNAYFISDIITTRDEIIDICRELNFYLPEKEFKSKNYNKIKSIQKRILKKL